MNDPLSSRQIIVTPTSDAPSANDAAPGASQAAASTQCGHPAEDLLGPHFWEQTTAAAIAAELATESSGVAPSTMSEGVPRWDRRRRVLLIGERVVLRLRRPAGNLETILMAFEAQGWSHRISDPLPPSGVTDRAQRRYDALYDLNGHQDPRSIRFFSDGKFLCWAFDTGRAAPRPR